MLGHVLRTSEGLGWWFLIGLLWLTITEILEPQPTTQSNPSSLSSGMGCGSLNFLFAKAEETTPAFNEEHDEEFPAETLSPEHGYATERPADHEPPKFSMWDRLASSPDAVKTAQDMFGGAGGPAGSAEQIMKLLGNLNEKMPGTQDQVLNMLEKVMPNKTGAPILDMLKQFQNMQAKQDEL